MLFVQWTVGVGANTSIVLLWSSSRVLSESHAKLAAIDGAIDSSKKPIRWHRGGVRNERRFFVWSMWFVDRFQVVAACESLCAEGGSMCCEPRCESVSVSCLKWSSRGVATAVCVFVVCSSERSFRVLGLDLFVVLAPIALGTSLKLLRRTQCAFD